MTALWMMLFWTSFAALAYIYGGYFCIVRILAMFVQPRRNVAAPTELPLVSIIITAHNEAASMARRIANLRALSYPSDRVELIVASDGSTDRTAELSRDLGCDQVLDFQANRGRAAAQNDAVAAARGELVVFTDADTAFEADFLDHVVRACSEPGVGCVVGNLIYLTEGNSVAESEGLYWRFEKAIRLAESRLAILSTGTGACMAVRRSLWHPLQPTDDCDFTTPLDVVLQGQRVVFEPRAVAYDTPASNLRQEFKTRVRQTSKNLAGTIRRWNWRGLVAHPVVSWGILSHKLMRWMTPFFLGALLVSNVLLCQVHAIYAIGMALQVMFYVSAAAGLLGPLISCRIPFTSTVTSFCVANLGMAVGVLRGVFGHAPSSYRKGGL